MDVICDLVLLSWNHLEETRPCLESLFRSTQVPSRLIIVDNASESSVRSFLHTVRPAGTIRDVVLIQNDTNEGFPRGMNRGLRVSAAPFVCLLNNDVLFGPGWLGQMIDLATNNPTIGVVNPSSGGLDSHPPSSRAIEEHAGRLASLRRRYMELSTCIGFCMLIKREVIERIGLLSEEVDRMFFEDEDFCMRAQRAGYWSVVAEAAFVYHAEHKSVGQEPDYHRLLAKNQRWCEERWGRRLRVAWPRFVPIEPGASELREWLERLVAWARRRVYVYIYSSLPSQVSRDELFESVGLIPHADVMLRRLPKHLTRWVAVSRILKRRKKRFDIIVAPDEQWAGLARRLQWLHGTDVVPVDDEQQLTEQWKSKSRCLS